jgi:hypothetical protein
VERKEVEARPRVAKRLLPNKRLVELSVTTVRISGVHMV